jgi:hypothetical protein
MAIEPIKGSHLIRHTVDDLTLGARPDSIPNPHFREIADAKRSFYRPSLPDRAEVSDNLKNAHASVDAIADSIRGRVAQIWQSEPDVGITLTSPQKHAWRKAEVAKVVASELESGLKLVRPVVEREQKALETRRDALTRKGRPELSGIRAERALRIVDHFSTLPAEVRVLKILDAVNSLDLPASRELCESVAWAGENFDLCAPETLARVRGALVVASDSREYAALVATEQAVVATQEGIAALERWSESLSEELG